MMVMMIISKHCYILNHYLLLLGNILYKSGDYDGALQYYSEAIAYCPIDDHENLAIFLGILHHFL